MSAIPETGFASVSRGDLTVRGPFYGADGEYGWHVFDGNTHVRTIPYDEAGDVLEALARYEAEQEPNK